jgi:hypothetical protein
VFIAYNWLMHADSRLAAGFLGPPLKRGYGGASSKLEFCPLHFILAHIRYYGAL